MKYLQQKQRGFALVEGLIILVVIAVLVSVGIFVFSKSNKSDSDSSSGSSNSQSAKGEAKIKHLGVNFGAFDPSTGMAGDFKFTKDTLQFNRIFFEYGFVVPANSVGPEKQNPQPTYIVPLGTKVHALVDGEVYDVPKLYSNDYSVMVKGEGSDLIFETEHVMNVLVKKGDKVKAGQVIAEVSDYDAKNYGGLGLVEIGILKGGNPPSHVCPFDYLDDSIKEKSLKQISDLVDDWEEYMGDSKIYNQEKFAIPGCLTNNPIEG